MTNRTDEKQLEHSLTQYIFSILLSSSCESDSSDNNQLIDKNENIKSRCFTFFAILLTFLLFWLAYYFINCSYFLIAILYIPPRKP